MIIAGSSLIFSKHPLESALAGVRELGFTHVDLAAIEGWAHINPSELAADTRGGIDRLKRLLERHQLALAALNARADTPAQMVALATLGQELGSRTITVGASRRGSDPEKDYQRLSEFTAAAASHGVTICVETHFDTLTEELNRVLEYPQRVPGLGIALDPSHLICAGYSTQDLLPLLPYVKHVHLRPGGVGWDQIQLPCGHGLVDFPWLIEQLRQADYEGVLTVEYVQDIGAIDHSAEAVRLKELAERILR